MTDENDTTDTDGYPKSETVKEWEHAGYPCEIVRIERHSKEKQAKIEHITSLRRVVYNGYVMTACAPDGGDAAAYQPLPVHGGVTYGPDENGKIGFDTLHHGDLPGERNGENVTDMAWLTAETEKLAEGVARLEAGGVPIPELPDGAREAVGTVYGRVPYDGGAVLAVVRQWLADQETRDR